LLVSRFSFLVLSLSVWFLMDWENILQRTRNEQRETSNDSKEALWTSF